MSRRCAPSKFVTFGNDNESRAGRSKEAQGQDLETVRFKSNEDSREGKKAAEVR
jgi:hypothetical protein